MGGDSRGVTLVLEEQDKNCSSFEVGDSLNFSKTLQIQRIIYPVSMPAR